jgi:hypothetical protein
VVEAHNMPIRDGGFSVEFDSGAMLHWVQDPDGSVFYNGLGANPGTYRFTGSCAGGLDSPGVEAVFTITDADPVYLADVWRLLPDVLAAPGDDTYRDLHSLARGSGCVVDGTTLPDGVWFGFVRTVSSGEITFDLACFFVGQSALDAADADGGSIVHTLEITGTYGDGRPVVSPEPAYVRNRNPQSFSVPIDPEGEVWNAIASTEIDSLPTPLPMTAWPSVESPLQCPGPECGVWLYVNSGRVTAIVEQYLW